MLIALFLIAILSITLFEAFIILLLPYLFYQFIKGRLKDKGALFIPLVLHAFVILLSTLVYNPTQVGKAIERSLFLLAYPFGGLLKVDEKSLYRFNLFLMLTGLSLIPLVFYRFFKTGQPAMLWGGWFEVGAFYTIFAVASLSLTFYTKRLIYLLPFVLFISMVFFTMRRSTMLGLAFSLIAFSLLGVKNKKALWGIILTLLLSFITSTVILINKDPRYQTLYEVMVGAKSLNDETLNIISSLRWQIAKAGIEVIKRDIREGSWLPLLIGHGIDAGYRLEPKSPVGGTYESVFILSEFIEKGLLGLLAILCIYLLYVKFLVSFRVHHRRDYLLMPLFLALGSHLTGSIFTFFWDAMLPLYLILFRVVESLRTSPQADEPFPQGR